MCGTAALSQWTELINILFYTLHDCVFSSSLFKRCFLGGCLISVQFFLLLVMRSSKQSNLLQNNAILQANNLIFNILSKFMTSFFMLLRSTFLRINSSNRFLYLIGVHVQNTIRIWFFKKNWKNCRSTMSSESMQTYKKVLFCFFIESNAVEVL